MSTGALVGTTTAFAKKVVSKTIANALFGGKKTIIGKANIRNIYQRKLNENVILPKVFGNVKIAGNIIWTSDVKEHIKSERQGNKLHQDTNIHYTYTVSIAVSICEGKISSIGRIWADDILLYEPNKRVYYGDAKQKSDPLLEAIYGKDAPTYNGIAYVMFQDFEIGRFDNSIPEFKFEVFRHSLDKNDIENLIESVVIIPGCGEFVYDTKIQHEGTPITAINQHQIAGTANSVISFQQMKSALCNVKWIAPVVSWFASDLNIKDCKILPKAEKKAIENASEEWKVCSINRSNAEVISTDDKQKLSYGGTPSDQSIVRYLQYVKSQGISVMFYPMIFVDAPGKPWRGKIYGSSEDVQKFFHCEKYGYNQFILHYAKLVKGYVNAFLIGSELEDLTRICNANGEFVVVNELVNLAKEVKAILGPNVKISYAANWSEYHSINGVYHMDKLWASEYIDFIGIDAYFPLTNVNKSEYNYENILQGWNTGEGYDYDNNQKHLLSEQYAWKNIEFWWKNYHVNPNGQRTEWKPKMKKIWFTEYGFASVDCSTNQPNVFVDASSIESNLPKHSKGEIDILTQRMGIKATELRWRNSELVERKFLWTWDARPYPAITQHKSVWSDANNWYRGHWINGKVGAVELQHVIREICISVGFSENDIDVTNIHGLVYGLIIFSHQSAKQTLEMLQKAYYFDIFEMNGKITFQSRKNREIKVISADDLLMINDSEGEFIINVENKNDIPNNVIIYYIHPNLEINQYHYQNINSNSQKITIELDLSFIVGEEDIKSIAKNIIQQEINYKTTYKFYLSLESVLEKLWCGDIISIRYREVEYIMQITHLSLEANHTVKIECIDYVGYELKNISLQINQNNDDVKIIPESRVETFYIPGKSVLGIVAAGYNDHWYGCRVDYTFKHNHLDIQHKSITIKNSSIIGKVKSFIQHTHKNYFTIDRNSQFIINTYGKQLFSISESELFTCKDKNLAIIGNEIIRFSNAILQSDGTYVISGLLRCLYGTNTEIYDRFILLNEQSIKEIPMNIQANNIKFTVQTFIDRSLLYTKNDASSYEFELESLEFLFPVNLQMNTQRLSWIPRILSHELFNDNINFGFYIQCSDQNNRIVHKGYTSDLYYDLPQENLNNIVRAEVAVFHNNRIASKFAVLNK